MNKILNNFFVSEHYLCKYKKEFIYLDVNTLDVFILDEIDNCILKTINNYPDGEGLNIPVLKYSREIICEHIDELQKNCIINVLENKIEKEANEFNYESDNIYSLDVIITEDCNLACKYCFVKKNKYLGKSALMQFDVSEKTINFLIQNSGNIDDLYICFFGGEPLMNFKVMEKMVNYALEEGLKNKKAFHFSLTTNGTLLSDEIIEFLDKHQISVQISIDGNNNSHNLNRPFSGGADSYYKIEQNVKKLDQRNMNYTARATVTSFTKSNIAENFDHFISMGFKRVHFENAMAPKGKIYINQKDEIKEIKKQYSIISKRISKNIRLGIPCDFESLPLPLGKILSKSTNLCSCTAGRGYLSVDTKGDLYLCHRFVGDENFNLGNIIDDTYNAKLSEIMKSEVNVEKRKKCSKCWARYICGGGCYEINYTYNKDIFLTPETYCQLMKHNIKLALKLYALASE